MRTKRLQRQLKKSFGDDAVEENLPSLAASADPTAVKALAEGFPQFLDSVEETYLQLEERVNLAQRSMELSAAELTESNANLFKTNLTFDAMLNSLGQGFMLFGPDGIALKIYSKACEELLETLPAGKHAADILGVPEHKKEAFNGWMQILFQDRLEFTEFAKLGPKSFAHSQGRKISIEYRPVRGSSGQIDFVMAIATDFTKEYEAAETAKEMRAHLLLVTSIIRDKDRFVDFVALSRKLIRECEEFLRERDTEQSFVKIKRHIHTLKGASGSFGMLAVQTRLHDLESEIAKRETAAESMELLKREIPGLSPLFERTLEENSHIIGNITISEEPQRRVPVAKLVELEKILSDSDAPSEATALASELLSLPCAEIFARYESTVRDTAAKLGKKIQWKVDVDGDIRLVPENYESVFENLDHLFRNIVDHGIETADERSVAGKDRLGTISVAVKKADDRIEIRIGDDGRGINTDKLRAKLVERGMQDLAVQGEDKILEAIFLPGISTADSVTQTSGRGVGMEAVRSSIESCGGIISLESFTGKGTSFFISLPVSGRARAPLRGLKQSETGKGRAA